MKRSIVSVSLALALMGGAGNSMQPGKAHASGVTRSAQSRLLYQTNWRHGTVGWASEGGSWDAVSGMLTYDGSGGSTILTAYKLKAKQKFAVEATIQTLRHDSYNGNWGFGLIVRAYKPVNLFSFIQYGPGGDCCYSGFTVGMQGRSGYTDSHPDGTFASIWNTGIYPEELDRSDFNPGTGWHTYRVEVRGNDIRLLVDGQRAAETRSNKYLNGTRVGLFSMYSEINVRSFKVYSLP